VKVLLLNAGSSSLKGTLMESDGRRIDGHAAADWAGPSTHYQCERSPGQRLDETVAWRGHAEAVRRVLADLVPASQRASLGAVGHRVVHGGEFTSSVLVSSAMRARTAALAELAPLHNPPSLAVLEAAEAELPDAPHVAIFDTAFHATLPPAARAYALPQAWARDWGIRRYGFHGLSHDYCSGRAAELLGRPAVQLRLVICHLGHGCSAAAVMHGRSVDTSMGFTPIDGLVMATRSGALDPGIVLHVQLRHGLSTKEVERALNRESGLLGLTGSSGDMREVLAAIRRGDERARLALDVYAHRLRQTIGAFTATLGGIDGLVFTAGVGENAAAVRQAACQGLEHLGLQLDAEANDRGRPDVDVARPGSPARILVIATREDLTMLREVMQLIERR
jgi:acetate kinase